MTTYSLITVRDDKLAGIQPIRGSKLEDVINFTFGVLSERTESDAAMFAALGVEWVLEKCRDDRRAHEPRGSGHPTYAGQ